MSPRDLVQSARLKVERVAYVIRRVIGVPDYERYVAHLRAHHPEVRPMPREEFDQQRLADRYSKPGARCC